MLSSDIIRRVKEIQIRTGRQVADVLAGEYGSAFRGSGVEFEEVRPYIPGDDVRSIDWNVTARAGEPYIKRYVEERELTLMIMADISASQNFGSSSRSKREATAELCALLGFSAINNNDKVGLILFHGEVEQFIPPRKGQKHALRVVREVLAHGELEAAQRETDRDGISLMRHARRLLGRFKATHRLRDASQATDIGRALEFLMSVNKRRSVCFVISDFMDQNFEQALSIAARRHDVIAVLVTDPRELQFPKVGLIALQDAETGEEQIVDTDSATFRRHIEDSNAERIRSLEQRLRRRGIDLIKVNAAEATVEPLIRFFRMRDQRSRR